MSVVVMIGDEVEAQTISYLLSSLGAQAAVARGLDEVEKRLAERRVALIVVDAAALGDGAALSPLLIAERFDGSVLAIGDSADVWSKVRALDQGADDYIARPYEPAELLARARAALRRTRRRCEGAQDATIRAGAISLDAHSLTVSLPGHRRKRLTPSEMQALRVLMLRAPSVVSRQELSAQIFGVEAAYDSAQLIAVYINRLRRKIERDAARPRHIITVRGSGYRFEPGDEQKRMNDLACGATPQTIL